MLVVLAFAPSAHALIARPVTLAGPSADVLDLGGVAIARDGTGGIVYTKAVDGVPHVFAVPYARGSWGRPVRVDWDRPFDGGSPRIAAGSGGRLLVVWVTQMATIHNRIQRGLVSATLARGADAFGPSLVIDGNVGSSANVSPVLSRAAAGQAIVTYRVVTNDFGVGSPFTDSVPSRPGDVLADIRLARLAGPTWSRIGSINRNPAASMRPPSAVNGPQVVADPGGNAVVAWQEPDQTGTARIWLRRIFGTVPGPVLEASPTTWDGRPVTDDADALSLSATSLGLARIALRVDGSPDSGLGGPQLFLNTLPSSLDADAGKLTGATVLDAGDDPSRSGEVSAPSVSTEEGGGADGSLWLGFASAGALRLATVDARGNLVAGPATGLAVAPGGDIVTAVDPAGGGVAAWSAIALDGHAAVGVREDFPSGAAQTATVTGAQSGPVSQLSIGRADTGDAIVAFRQGDPGHFEIVTDRVTVPPASFALIAPADWVAPRRARVRWAQAPSEVGGLRYTVLLDGRPVARELTQRSLTLRPGLVGDGVRHLRVLATDALGQQLLSPSVDLQVDARPPTVTVSGSLTGDGRRLATQTNHRTASLYAIVVRVRDRESGAVAGATSCSFGDGARALRGRATCRHVYAHAGRYTIVVRTRDRVGNRGTRRLPVHVR